MTQVITEQQYKRNQMEIGITKALIRFPKASENSSDADAASIPSRIKKFLEADREIGKDNFAFIEDAEVGKGKERDFSLFDCFMMSLALQMFHSGFDQSSTIKALQSSKNTLRETFQRISNDNYVEAAVIESVASYPEAKGKVPTIMKGKEEIYDANVYFIMSPGKILGLNSGYVTDQFISLRPVIAYGFQDLQKYIMEETLINFTLIELVKIIKRLRAIVPSIPAAKRGRKATLPDNKINQSKDGE